jgi:uncharacterized integral membrane protein
MRKLANLLSGLILVLVFLAAITFSYFNTTPVSLKFGNLVLAAQPVAVWIIAAFVIGGGLGLLLGLGLFRSLRSGAELRRNRKELAAAKQELNKLRAMSLRDLD